MICRSFPLSSMWKTSLLGDLTAHSSQQGRREGRKTSNTAAGTLCVLWHRQWRGSLEHFPKGMQTSLRHRSPNYAEWQKPEREATLYDSICIKLQKLQTNSQWQKADQISGVGWEGWITKWYKETLGVFGGVFMGVFLCRDYVGNISYYTLYVQYIVCQLYLNKTAF